MKKRIALKVTRNVNGGAIYLIPTMRRAARRLGYQLTPYTIHQTLKYRTGEQVEQQMHLFFIGHRNTLGDGIPRFSQGLGASWWLPAGV